MKKLIMIAVVGVVGGCEMPSILTEPTQSPRAKFGNAVLATRPTTPEVGSGFLDTPVVELNRIGGTWTFTVPPTVTQVERRTAEYHQFSLYVGRPAPTDTPFLVITVGRNPKSVVWAEPQTYKNPQSREYILNGEAAAESVGLTDSGAAYTELVVTRAGSQAGTSDACHALAIAKNDEQRKLALEILQSIVWKPNQ